MRITWPFWICLLFRIVLKRGLGREGGRTERNGRWGKAETRLHFLSVRPEKPEGKGLSGLGGPTNSTRSRLLDLFIPDRQTRNDVGDFPPGRSAPPPPLGDRPAPLLLLRQRPPPAPLAGAGGGRGRSGLSLPTPSIQMPV